MARRANNPAERQFDVLVGQRIRNIRKARKVTCIDLAEAVGTTQQRMFQFEQGTRVPLYLLVKIARVMRLDLNMLVPETISNCNNGNSCRSGAECV